MKKLLTKTLAVFFITIALAGSASAACSSSEGSGTTVQPTPSTGPVGGESHGHGGRAG